MSLLMVHPLSTTPQIPMAAQSQTCRFIMPQITTRKPILRAEARYLCGVLSRGAYRLRAMEPQDAHLLHQWENRAEEWWLGAQLAPISLEAMQRFAAGQHDVWADRQLRLMLDVGDQTVGAFDLYDVDPRSRRAGVGLAVGQAFRKQGHAQVGLALLMQYAFEHLGLRMLFAEVPADNPASLHIFTEAQFTAQGTLEQWVKRGGTYADVLLMQAFSPEHDG